MRNDDLKSRFRFMNFYLLNDTNSWSVLLFWYRCLVPKRQVILIVEKNMLFFTLKDAQTYFYKLMNILKNHKLYVILKVNRA